MDPSFWQGKRVFVTGHTGFKGSWLTIWLRLLGADVTGYALEPETDPSMFESCGVDDGINSVIGDIRDRGRLLEAMKAAKPEIVLHLAAQALVRPSYEDPITTYETNVMGTANLLDVIREIGGVRVVNVITTDKCYENREWPWGYRETDRMGGHDPYSNSKACAELVASCFRNSYFSPSRYESHGVALGTARAGNVLGGGDWSADRLVPDAIRAFLASETVSLRFPGAVRPWQHVLEPLGGYLSLCESLWNDGPAFSEAWNFGPVDRDARPVSWVVEKLASLWGEGAKWEIDGGDHPHETNYLKLDISKAKSGLGWEPRLGIEECLEWVHEWYSAYANRQDPRKVSEEQIKRFMEHS